MTLEQGQRMLDALLGSWDRSNTSLINLLRVIPKDGLDARAMEGSPTVAEMLTHLHRRADGVGLQERSGIPGPVPAQEWDPEPDPTASPRCWPRAGSG